MRLHGIDAPESDQTCLNGGQRWPCGRLSTQALYEQVSGNAVRCVGDDQDPYERLIAVCYADGTNLNAWMVGQGWAVAYRRYSPAFMDEERQAKSEGAGVWQGQILMPWTGGGGSASKVDTGPDQPVLLSYRNRQGV